VEQAAVVRPAVWVLQAQRLLVEVVVRGRPALESVLAKVLHQALREPQLNTAAVEMVTTLLEQQEPHDQVQEVMA
jgi:hypothetical protein